MPEIPELTEAESFRRGIFPFEIAGVRALADPLKVLNRIYEVLPEFDDQVARFFASPAPAPAESDGEVEPEEPSGAARRGVEMIAAATALEPAVLAGFKLQPLGDDGSGVSTTEAMALLASFLGWQDRRQAIAGEREAESGAVAPPIAEATA